jgi:hypothetical protein
MTKQPNARKIILAAGAIIVLLSVAVLPAMAYTDLKITNARVTYLQRPDVWTIYQAATSTTPASYILNWAAPGLNLPYQYSTKITKSDGTTITAYSCSSPTNTYPGKCTSFVESASNSKLTTGSWKQGRHVVDGGIITGTAIATLDKNGYITGGHSAIFASYYYSNGKIAGILVWDQNYYPNAKGVIGYHCIKIGGSTFNSNANNYYVIQV